MNIIEDIGILNAKALDRMLTQHGVPEDWKILLINGAWYRSSKGFTHKQLRNAVAEYEQQAQQEPVAYKQGDLVVLTYPEASDCIAIFGEIDPMGNYWLEWQSGGEFCVFDLKELRPATEQEKLVGHRI